MKTTRNVLVLLLVVFSCAKADAAIFGYAAQGFGDNNLHSINLNTGASTAIGAIGIDNDVLSLAMQSGSGTLFGYTDAGNIITIDKTTGAGTLVGATGLGSGQYGGGLSFDPTSGNLYLADEDNEHLYTVNTSTGAVTSVGALGQSVAGLAFRADGTLFGLADTPDDNFLLINPLTAAVTVVGSLSGTPSQSYIGADFDDSGTLWMIGSSSRSDQINTATGAATQIATTAQGFTCLAISKDVPEPTTLAIWGMFGGLGLIAARRRKRAA